MDDNEKCCLYKLNRDHVPESNHYDKIGEETRLVLEDIVTLATGRNISQSETVEQPDTQSHAKQDTVGKNTTGFHQESKLCECQKSYWTVGGKCNVCGIERDVEDVVFLKVKAKKIKRLWSKKLHRYLTQDEIKTGIAGG